MLARWWDIKEIVPSFELSRHWDIYMRYASFVIKSYVNEITRKT